MTKTQQEEFSSIIGLAADQLGVRSLALEFAVNPSTVSRWAAGKTVPHPMIQAHVLTALEGRVDLQGEDTTEELLSAIG